MLTVGTLGASDWRPTLLSKSNLSYAAPVLIAPGSIPRSLLRTFNFEIWKLKCLGACPEDLYSDRSAALRALNRNGGILRLQGTENGKVLRGQLPHPEALFSGGPRQQTFTHKSHKPSAAIADLTAPQGLPLFGDLQVFQHIVTHQILVSP